MEELHDHCSDLDYGVIELDCMSCFDSFKHIYTNRTQINGVNLLPEFCPTCQAMHQSLSEIVKH
jgi:hypothetical protein